MANDKFYCYSRHLRLFLQAFDEKYIESGVNTNTNTVYYIFPKSERLDKIIVLYNSVKNSIQ